MLDAFGVRDHRVTWLIGGGGKTTLMYALASALAAEGRRVLTSTSTRIHPPRPEESPRLLLADGTPDLVGALRAALDVQPHATVALSRLADEGKLAGLPLATLDALAGAGIADHLIVEADGSAGRSLKAHLEHEPVVSTMPGLVIAVVGVDVLGRDLDDANVHRASLLRERLGRRADERIRAEDVAAAVIGPGGYASRIATGHTFAVFLSRVDGAESRRAAEAIAVALRAADAGGRIARIVAGDALTGVFVGFPAGA